MKTITATLTIAAKPNVVWAALTQPAGVAALYFGSKLVTTFQPGAPYRYEGDDGTVHVLGEILEHVEGERLVLTHRAGPRWQEHRPFQSRLAYVLKDAGLGTAIQLTQDQIEDDDPSYAHNLEGWAVFLSRVQSYVETGTVRSLS